LTIDDLGIDDFVSYGLKCGSIVDMKIVNSVE